MSGEWLHQQNCPMHPFCLLFVRPNSKLEYGTSFLLVEIISAPCVNSDYIKSDQNLWLPFINAFDFSDLGK